ncbi:transcription/translation regulatory transformer protein RfaH [Thalassotalea nanhaiensis]|uniref:Transcription/translation regulatory transformer protein RfaH n=1 Tax=Thalassotalea nanhaiensis TaxID=3065648 RepID=A0ABY9TM25_9GAMM|nr:transcription/translation regulatory transformer protein RfaH [Colwelliaceae bacterium SQ345]
MSKTASRHWYLLTSKPREEHRAFDNLTSQGHDVFLPKISKVVKRQGVKSVSLVPLFPNYLFICLDTVDANFNAIRSTRGVGAFVKFGLHHATIQSSLIDAIKRDVEAKDGHNSLEQLLNYSAGERVEISDGPFKGLQAIYKTKDGLERSILLINMLGQDNDVAIENQFFDKINSL